MALTIGSATGGCTPTFTNRNAGLPGLNNAALDWGDMDGDGDLDLVLMGQSNGQAVTRLYANVAGSFQLRTNAELPGGYSGAVAWGDYDNDGDLDLLLSGRQGDTQGLTRIYRNDGAGLVWRDSNAGLTNVFGGAVAWGDYDNDGDLDLVTTGYSYDLDATFTATRIYRNDAPVTPSSVRTFRLVGTLTGLVGGDLAWGDYDNDGLAVSGVWTFTDLNAGLPGINNSDGLWGDFDNDGDLDLALSGSSDSGFLTRIYRQERSPTDSRTFTLLNTTLTAVSYGALAWGDYDNDGDLDLVVAGMRTFSPRQYLTTLYRNEGVGSSGLWRFTDIGAALPGLSDGGVAWGDYDNDGDLDLALNGELASNTSPLPKRAYIYRNQNGLFSEAARLVDTYGGMVAWGDYDNDGDLDLLNVGYRSNANNTGYLYRNDSAGATTLFQLATSGQPGFSNGVAAWADYDGDHALDLLVAGDSAGSNSLLYRNRGCADLAAAVTVTPNPAQPAAGLTYAVTIHNTGPQTAYNVQAVDTLPGDVSAVSCQAATPATCQVVNGKPTLTLTMLAANATATLTITVNTPTRLGTLTNQLHLSADNERNSANNAITTVTLLNTADLAVSAQVTPTWLTAGEPLTYTVTLTNLGLGAAQGVKVVHTLGGDATGLQCTVSVGALCQQAGRVITATFGALAGLATGQMTLTLPAPDHLGVFTGTTRVSAANDLNPNNNSAATAVTIGTEAETALAAFAAPTWAAVNAPLTYTVVITNGGPHLARTVRVTTTLPPTVTLTGCQAAGGLCQINGGQAIATYATLGVTAPATITLNAFTPNTLGVITATVTMTAPNDGDTLNNTALISTTLRAADLTVSLQVTPTQAATDDLLTYRIQVENLGTLTADGVRLVTTLPVAVTGVVCTAPGATTCLVDGGVITTTYTTLAPLTITPVTLTLAAPDQLGALNAAAQIDAINDNNAANNQATTNITVTTAADVSLIDLNGPATVRINTPATYHLTLVNDGPQLARQVAVTITLPPTLTMGGCQVAAGALCQVTGGQAVARYAALAVRVAEPITLTMTAPAMPGVISVTAVATATNEREPSNNGSGPFLTTIQPVSDLAVGLWPTINPALANSPLTYTVALTNHGPHSATDVELYVTLPTDTRGERCQVALGGDCRLDGEQVTVRYPRLDVGATTQIMLGLTAPNWTGDLVAWATVQQADDLTPVNNSAESQSQVVRPMPLSLVTPLAQAQNVATNAAIVVAFPYELATSTVTSRTFAVHGDLSGHHNGAFSYSSALRRLTFTLDRPFQPGEVVRVSATAAVRSVTDDPLAPIQWQFTIGAPQSARCAAGFSTVIAPFPGLNDSTASWGDYDGDGDLDLLTLGDNNGQRVTQLFDNMGGAFQLNSAAAFPGLSAGDAAWGDYDNDGDLDLLLTGDSGGGVGFTGLYRNNGDHTFSNTNAGLTNVANSAVAWGDYDNDGDLDLVLSGHSYDPGVGGDTTRLYRNDSTPAGVPVFVLMPQPLPNATAGDLVWGDYDNDGDLDLFITGGSAPARLYRNEGVVNGNPILNVVNTPFATLAWSAAAWGDYDNDGDLDLALNGALDQLNSATYLYRNAGNGLFHQSATLAASDQGSVAWGDYDNDGDLDLAISADRYLYRQTVLYRNDGATGVTPNFTRLALDLGGSGRGGSAWGDYDGDGALDLIVTGTALVNNTWTASTNLYRNAGCAAVALTTDGQGGALLAGDPVQYRLTVQNRGPQPAQSVVITDQLPLASFDLTCQTSAAGSCQVIDNEVQVTYPTLPVGAQEPITLTWTAPVNTGLYTKTALLAAGNLSVTAASRLTESFSVLNLLTVAQHQPAAQAVGVAPTSTLAFTMSYPIDSATVTSRTVQVYGALGGLYTGTIGYDRFERTLLFTPTYPFRWGEQVAVSLNRSLRSPGYGALAPYQLRFTIGNRVAGCDPTLQEQSVGLPPLQGSALAWADYDLDGDLDLLLSGLQNGQAFSRLYTNQGGSFQENNSVTLVQVHSGAAAWGDYDGDGDPDLLLTGDVGSSAPATRLYRNEGGNFTDTNATLMNVSASAVAWADYDNDGDLDLLLTGYSRDPDVASTYGLRLYRNDGSSDGQPRFTTVDTPFPAVTDGNLAWGDYDNDGLLDLAISGVAGPVNSITVLYRNAGNGAFVAANAGLPGLHGSALAWGDYDGDGFLDLLVNGSNGAGQRVTLLYRNGGDGSFSQSASLAGASNGAVAWVDYDSDGDLDAFTSGGTGANPLANLYRNQGSVNGVPTFHLLGLGLPGITEGAAAWADVDQDGAPDLLLSGLGLVNSNWQGITHLYRSYGCGYETPTPTPTATSTPTLTPSATPTDTPTATPTPLPVDTATPTSTPVETATATAPTVTPTATATSTATPVEIATATPTPTTLPVDTATATVTPTPTNMPTPTDTPTVTATVLPSDTPTPTMTNTQLPGDTPTATATPTHTPTTTAVDTPTATVTPTATDTPAPTPTNGDAPTMIATATAATTATPSATVTSTNTTVPGATATATVSSTPMPTVTSTATAPLANTGTSTPTGTVTPTTPTATSTTPPGATATATLPTATSIATVTPTATATATTLTTPPATHTPTATGTMVVTPTSTATLTPIATDTPTTTTTLIATSTPTVVVTPTPSATATLPPRNTPTTTLTATSTEPPTATPTDTATVTSTASNTATPLPTNTMLPSATATPTPTNPLLPTNTLLPTPTNAATATPTLLATNTALPTETPTSTPSATITPTATTTATVTMTPSLTPTVTGVPTVPTVPTVPVVTDTPTPIETPTATVTASPTGATTLTPTETLTPMETATPTATGATPLTETATATLTPTALLLATATATATLPVLEPTATATITPSPTAPDNGVAVLVQPDQSATVVYELTVGGRVVLTAPMGAVTQPVTLRFTAAPTVNEAPVSLQFVNHAFHLVAYQGDVPLAHFQFAQPVTLALEYTDLQVAGLDELKLTFYYFDEAVGQWRSDGITIIERDPVNNRLVVQIAHLTTFALFGSTLTDVPTMTPTPTPTPGQALYLPLIQRTGFKQHRPVDRVNYCQRHLCLKRE